MSRGIKLVLMGVAGAALLYSCAPAIGGGGGFFWLLPWLFRGGPSVTAPTTPGQTATKPTPGETAPTTTQSQRGGFGSTGNSGSSSGSS
ncbi:MAG: hypothetical protein ISP45_13745 [Reyranella sp.]|jgi:hypothetical protein|nr:hypothetical protein [Reyranella sp.]